VYTLWKNPQIIPLLYTPSFVMVKISGGADLMTPGLGNGPPFPNGATKGAVVAVAEYENPSVPLAVGICKIDVSSLGSVQGMKGVAVEMSHWYGDELWNWNSGSKGGGKRPKELEGWTIGADRGAKELNFDKLDIADDDEDEDEEYVMVTPMKEKNEFVEGEDHVSGMDNDYDEKELTTKEIDAAFVKAFCYGIHEQVKSHNSYDTSHGFSFPLSSSYIIADLVLPFLPTFTPLQTSSLQIKKTSWKNAKKFIKYLDKTGLISTKERNGGEIVVLGIDFRNEAIQGFKPYRLPKKEPPSKPTTTEDPSPLFTADSSIGQELRRIALYKPKEKLSPIFEASLQNTRSYYLPSELHALLKTYIEKGKLEDSKNKRLIKLDPILSNTLFNVNDRIDAEILSKGNFPRDKLPERLINQCSPFWAILKGKETKEDVKPHAGAPPQIQVILEQVRGTKTSSKISGVETYGVNPSLLADELRKTCAGSTSVKSLVGAPPASGKMEIMIQGTQTKAIVEALERRGIQRGWVEVIDKMKLKKASNSRGIEGVNITNTRTGQPQGGPSGSRR
jgi:translation initiation factor 2D